MTIAGCVVDNANHQLPRIRTESRFEWQLLEHAPRFERANRRYWKHRELAGSQPCSGCCWGGLSQRRFIVSDQKQRRPANGNDSGGGRASTRRRLTGLAAIAAGLVLVSVLVAVGLVAWSLTTEVSSDGPRTAVIVDQLSLTVPNQAFVTAAPGLPEEAGYRVDYYSGDEITVDFYTTLPTRVCDYIVMRVDSGLYAEEGPGDGCGSEGTFLPAFRSDACVRDRSSG